LAAYADRFARLCELTQGQRRSGRTRRLVGWATRTLGNFGGAVQTPLTLVGDDGVVGIDTLARNGDEMFGEHTDPGFQLDLARLISRRGALGLAAASVAAMALAACGSSVDSTVSIAVDSNSTGTATTTSLAAGASSSASSASSSSLGGPKDPVRPRDGKDGPGGPMDGKGGPGGGGVTAPGAIPEETAGPFPGDGSNGPNLLTTNGVMRSDVRASLGGGGVAAGVPTMVNLSIVSTTTGQPIPGAAVYIWHCDSQGRYSMYDLPDENYLRGVQVADANGLVTFTTAFPGCYNGRWPHIHFEVYRDLSATADANAKIATSQLALVEEVCREVYKLSEYDGALAALNGTSLASDMVFSDGVALETPVTTGNVSTAITMALNVPVAIAK
jgi:protocatechuate 3,4-dioxygenase beta subunit